MALIKSQFPSSCSLGFLLYQSLQISLGVQMVVLAAFHYHPPKSATPVLASLFFSWNPIFKNFLASLSVLIWQAFRKTNHFFSLSHFLGFIVISPVFSLVSLAISSPLFGFLSSALFLDAGMLQGFVLRHPVRGEYYFSTWINSVSCLSRLCLWPCCSPQPHTVILVSQKCQDMVILRDCALAVLSGWKSLSSDL